MIKKGTTMIPVFYELDPWRVTPRGLYNHDCSPEWLMLRVNLRGMPGLD